MRGSARLLDIRRAGEGDCLLRRLISSRWVAGSRAVCSDGLGGRCLQGNVSCFGKLDFCPFTCVCGGLTSQVEWLAEI
jgi:hypothetical protein